MVVCLEQGADLRTAQLTPLPLTVSCFSKIQIGFTFLVPGVCVCGLSRELLQITLRLFGSGFTQATQPYGVNI